MPTSDGRQNGTPKRPSGAKRIKKHLMERLVGAPALHETIVVTVPLGPRGFLKVILSIEIDVSSFFCVPVYHLLYTLSPFRFFVLFKYHAERWSAEPSI